MSENINIIKQIHKSTLSQSEHVPFSKLTIVFSLHEIYLAHEYTIRCTEHRISKK